MPRIAFTKEQQKEIVDAYQRGDSPVRIGKRIRRNADTIRRVLTENGVRLRDRSDSQKGHSPANKMQFDQTTINRMIARHEEGASLKVIGEEFGISTGPVSRVLNDAKVSTARKPALTAAQKAQVRKRYKAGENIRPLSEAFEVSTVAIRRVLKDSRIRIRSISETARGREAHNKLTFSAAQVGKIRKMWVDEGKTLVQIGETLGISPTPIHRLIREKGYKKLTPAELRRQRQRAAEAALAKVLGAGGVDKATKWHRLGHSFAEIADKLKVSQKLLRPHLVETGLSNYGATLPLDVRKYILKRYGRREGGRINHLAEEIGLSSPQTVNNFLRSRGVDTTYSFAFTEADVERMRRLYEQGKGTHEIAALFGEERDEDIHWHTISRALREAGIPLSGYSLAIVHESPSAGTVKLHSSWEKDVAVYLDRLVEQGDIAQWEYESLDIPYRQGHKCRTYIPDFVVRLADGSEQIIEVKGAYFSGTDAKTMAAREAGYSVRIIDERSIREVWDEILEPWDWDWA